MCLACIEFVQGNITEVEFKRNIREMVDNEHDPMALRQARMSSEDVKKISAKRKLREAGFKVEVKK